VNRHFVDGKERMTVYGEKDGQHVLLVFSAKAMSINWSGCLVWHH